MAVARHGVNRCQPVVRQGRRIRRRADQLGATIAFKSLGVDHVAVADLILARLDKALKVGADAVINSGEEDVAARLLELHGEGDSMFGGRVGTDGYISTPPELPR